jgi:TolB protein
MDADGRNVVRLAGNDADDDEPPWSPNGSRITFISNHDGNAEIYVMNADGSGLRNLTNNPANDW